MLVVVQYMSKTKYVITYMTIFMIFITCQKRDILLRDITKKNSGWQNTRLNRVVLVNIETWVKAAMLQTVKTEKKGCVTPFYCVPRNKDRKRRWLTFLCCKTIPNVEYMYVCGEHLMTRRYIICHKTFFHFLLLLENFLYNL